MFQSDEGKNLYTQSRIAVFSDCPRKHQLAYELGYRKESTPKALRMGHSFHEGMELLSRRTKRDAKRKLYEDGVDTPSLQEIDQVHSDMVDDAIIMAIGQYDRPAPPYVSVTDWGVERETVGRMLKVYAWRWGEELIENLLCELPFALPIRTRDGKEVVEFVSVEGGPPKRIPQYRAGKIDKIVRLASGKLAILEHKTTGDSISPDSHYWKRRRMDRQTRFYFSAARDMGYNVEEIVYDVVKKPDIVPKRLTKEDFKKFMGVPDRSGEVDRKARHMYFGEKFEVKAKGTIEGPSKWMFESIKVDGWVAEQEGAVAESMTIRETPGMYGARLMADMLERPDHYFAREKIPTTDMDLEESKNDIVQYHRMIMECRKTGTWPRNTARCNDFGLCPYWGLCSENVDLDELESRDWSVSLAPYSLTKLAWVHPELDPRVMHPSEETDAGPLPEDEDEEDNLHA